MSKRLQMLDKVIARGSSDPFHYYARAMELRSLGEREQALAALQDVHQRFPDYVPTFLMAGQLAQELGRSEAARRWLERGVEVAQQAGDAHTVGELQAAMAALG